MRKPLALAIAVIVTLALAGCDTEHEAVDTLTGETMTLSVKEITITLSDTRRVPCIILSPGGRYQAMSCDWTHVDGSDNL